MSTTKRMQLRAKERLVALQRQRRDRRFVETMGRLVSAGILRTNLSAVRPHKRPVTLEDALWAGEVEPRIMELLPAIVLKRPSLLKLPKDLPEDLARVLFCVRRGTACPEFRSVPAAQYLPWVERIGRQQRPPSSLRSFRLGVEDSTRLTRLRETLPAKSDTDVLRLALRVLEIQTQRAQPSG